MKITLLGAGSHARALITLLEQCGYVIDHIVDINSVETTDEKISEIPVVNKNLLVITQALALKEGRFYNLTLSNSVGTSIYKDKVFCTAQDIDQSDNDYYTINKDTYTSDTTYDNDFIII